MRHFRLIAAVLAFVTFAVSAARQEAQALTINFEDNFRGTRATFPDGSTKLYPDPESWSFNFWPGVKWPESFGDGTNWLAGNGECQIYTTPYHTAAGKTPVPPELRYDPFSIAPDGLHIRAALLTPLQRSTYGLDGFRRFGSGILLSRFVFNYGKIRIVAKLPSARGSWPAFWLLPENHQWPPEIDIMEGMAWGDHAQQLHSGLFVPKGEEGGFGEWFDTGNDLSQGFHEYALNWTPETMTMLFDHKVIWKKSTPASMHQNMYLLINLAVGGQWPYNELHVPPTDSKDPKRLAQGSDLIQGDYPADLVIRSVTISPP